MVTAAAIALACATVVAWSTSGSRAADGGQRVSAPLTRTALEREVARTGLVAELERTLGAGFGGVWFDPDAVTLHVGVTSATAAQTARSAAAGAELAANVSATRVASSWTQIQAARADLDRDLADLFAREEVMSWIDPARNSVAIELGSSVPASRRAAVEERVRDAGVAVSVTVGPSPKLRVVTQASRCNAFVAGQAACDPTIVAGVTLQGEAGKKCTAGPAAVLKDFGDDSTATYILTAGHCIKKEGKVGGKWFAYNQAGELKEVGKAIEFLDDPTDKADVGVIKVESNYWAVNGRTPVNPTIAGWATKPEPLPFAVTGQAVPAVNGETCISGQRAGWQCGKIAKIKLKSGTVEELVEVVGPTVVDGDSGGPWSSKVNSGTVEGTHVGENETTQNPVFEPIGFSFAQLALKLELLTTANEKRPVCPMKDNECWIEAETYPATYSGTSALGNEELKTEAGTVECKTSFHGETETGLVHATYTECRAFGFLEATVSAANCDFRIVGESSGKTDLVCGGSNKLVVTAASCELQIGSQSGLSSVALKNESGSPKYVAMKSSISGIAYTVTKDGFLCPFGGTGAKTGATLTHNTAVAITGQDPAEPATKIGIEAR